MSGMLYMINIKFFIFLKDCKFLFFVTIFLLINLIFFSQPTLSETENSNPDDLLSSNENEDEEDDLEIPAFLRRQKN